MQGTYSEKVAPWRKAEGKEQSLQNSQLHNPLQFYAFYRLHPLPCYLPSMLWNAPFSSATKCGKKKEKCASNCLRIVRKICPLQWWTFVFSVMLYRWTLSTLVHFRKTIDWVEWLIVKGVHAFRKQHRIFELIHVPEKLSLHIYWQNGILKIAVGHLGHFCGKVDTLQHHNIFITKHVSPMSENYCLCPSSTVSCMMNE